MQVKSTLLVVSLLAASLLSPAAAQKKKFGTTDDRKAHALYKEAQDMLIVAGRHDVGKLNEALDKYKQALERDPEYIEALYAASEVYSDLGQPGN